MKANQFVLSLSKKEKMSKDITSFYFVKPKLFRFSAGQYLQMTLPHKHVDSRGSSRFFTIASAPDEEFVMITTKQTESSFKKALFDLISGAEVHCYGPMGTFIFT